MNLNYILASAIALCFQSYLTAQEQQFTVLGTQTFTIPSSVQSLKVECVGAGGAGGRVTPSNFLDEDAGGGGGGGAYARSISTVTADSTYNLFVGKGGKNDGSSLDGEASYFGTTSFVYADGGLTRSGNDNEAGVAGGQASNSIGDVSYSGGNGGNGDESDADGGGGGGAAGSTGNGADGGNLSGGIATANYGGIGGNGGPDGSNGAAGGDYGGGGGGSSANGSNDRNGGLGANGIVVLTWSEVTSVSPTLVCANADETVTITGTNFTQVDSVTLNGDPLVFSAINMTTIEVIISPGLTGGELFVFTENGVSKSDSILITSNSVSLNFVMNSITASYSGDTLSSNWYWYNCVNNDTITTDSIGSLTVSEVGVYGVYIEENTCITTAPCVVISEIAEPIDTTVIDTTVIDTTVIDTTTFIKEILQNTKFNIYPNPTQGKLNISLKEDSPISSIKIFGLNARMVYQEIYKKSLTSKILNLKNLNPGLYFIEITSENSTSIAKIVLE